jgi:pyranose oxidase
MNGQNPKQDPTLNLDNSAVTRSVGGMANHWTCCTPEPLPGVERPDTFDDAKWKALYTEARELIHTPIDAEGEGTQFEDSIRQQLVKRHLLKAFESEKRVFKAMPLACQRRSDNPDWVDWSSSSTVLGHIATDLANQKPVEHFSLWAEHQCTDLVRDPNTGNVMGAVVVDLRTKKRKFVTAERYVVCAGAVLTTQILTKSGFKEHLPALVSLCLQHVCYPSN